MQHLSFATYNPAVDVCSIWIIYTYIHIYIYMYRRYQENSHYSVTERLNFCSELSGWASLVTLGTTPTPLKPFAKISSTITRMWVVSKATIPKVWVASKAAIPSVWVSSKAAIPKVWVVSKAAILEVLVFTTHHTHTIRSRVHICYEDTVHYFSLFLYTHQYSNSNVATAAWSFLITLQEKTLFPCTHTLHSH